jgi:exodeoxyribonuclease VII large subunit
MRLWTEFALEGRMNPDDAAQNPVAPPVLTVSALNQAVARMMERNFPLTWVSGEISNFTRAASGHWYFTLKDDTAQVKAVMFRGRAQYAGFAPCEGDKVEVRAVVTLYAPRGEYQLSVEALRRAGIGNLYEAFQQLKAKLSAEGLFDVGRKRAISDFPRTIGVVTSLQAAALRDVLTTLRRRAAHVRVIVYPSPVQGEGAAHKIAQAIATASARAESDLLLLCRGGGAIEDLWSFNDESVARAIAACSMPVISGVGHETDFTIADFTADLRAPTPTAAAEMAAKPRAESLVALESHADDLRQAFRRRLSDASQALDWLSRRLVSPTAYLQHEWLRLTGLLNRLTHAMRSPLSETRFALMQLRTRWSRQLPETASQRKNLNEIFRKLDERFTTQLAIQSQLLSSLTAQLELLSPQRTLERGYAIVTDGKGRTLRAPKDLHPRQTVTVRLAEGSAEVLIASVQASLE